MNNIVDTHAHLDMPHFDGDREDAIRRADKAGVSTIVNVGIDLVSSRMAVQLAESHPQILAAVGIHPHETGQAAETGISTISELAGHPKVVAIGEIGLDFFRNLAPHKTQVNALVRQLDLAATARLPVIIHSRQAQNETQQALEEWLHRMGEPNFPVGVIHCFNGDTADARKYLDMGFYISLGAYIGYPSAARTHDTLRFIPSERLLIETDSPFLPPQIHRGQRNEPAYLPTTLAVLADIIKTTPERLAEQTTDNAQKLFYRGQFRKASQQ